MKPKELDCFELKNGQKGCLLHKFPNLQRVWFA